MLSGVPGTARSKNVVDGNAVFVWMRSDSTNCGTIACRRVQLRTRLADGTLGATQTLSAAGLLTSNRQVAVDANGSAVISWTSYDPATSCLGFFGCPRVQARACSAAGTLSPIQTLSTAGSPSLNVAVAVDANGNAVFGWTRPGCCPASFAEIRARSASGTLGPIQTPAAPGHRSSFGDVAFDANGNAILAWSLNDGSDGCPDETGCNLAQTRVRSPAGSFSPVQTLSAAGHTATTSRPLIAVDPAGNAVYAWIVWDCEGGFCDRVQARVRYANCAITASIEAVRCALSRRHPRDESLATAFATCEFRAGSERDSAFERNSPLG